MATIDPGSDAEDLLASIHLERYLNDFRQAGFLLARDFCHVDNTALNRLGVTATGHRKRILKLVEHIQLICQYQRKDSQLDRCNSESAIHEVSPEELGPLSSQGNVDTALKDLQNNPIPNLSAIVKRSHSERSPGIIKPVPKPRTVFNKQKVQQPSLPTRQSRQMCRRSSQDSEILKGSPAEESSSVSIGTRRNLFKDSTISAPETSGPLPPVPPRFNRGIPPSTFRRMSDQDQLSTPSLSSSPESPSSYQCSPFTSTPGSPPSPPCSSLEMVSNEIYCGTLPGTPPTLWRRSVPTPPPRQELNTSTESNR